MKRTAQLETRKLTESERGQRRWQGGLKSGFVAVGRMGRRLRPGFGLLGAALIWSLPSPQATAQTCQDGCDLAHDDTFLGEDALISDTTGSFNTATGVFALESNTTGSDNTATGGGALLSNTIGDSNTATGVSALESNTTGLDNTATGAEALNSNTTGTENTATGSQALLSNTTGIENTATGYLALGIQHHRRFEHRHRFQCAGDEQHGQQQHGERF